MERLQKGQPSEERYQMFLTSEKFRMPNNPIGKIRAIINANLKTAWAEITEMETGKPLETDQIVTRLEETSNK